MGTLLGHCLTVYKVSICSAVWKFSTFPEKQNIWYKKSVYTLHRRKIYLVKKKKKLNGALGLCRIFHTALWRDDCAYLLLCWSRAIKIQLKQLELFPVGDLYMRSEGLGIFQRRRWFFYMYNCWVFLSPLLSSLQIVQIPFCGEIECEDWIKKTTAR